MNDERKKKYGNLSKLVGANNDSESMRKRRIDKEKHLKKVGFARTLKNINEKKKPSK